MFAWGISTPEVIVLLVLAVLLFGRRLPEIASSVGRSLRTFQNSWRGMEDEMQDIGRLEPARSRAAVPQRIGTALPNFEDNHVAPEPPLAG